MDDSYFMPRICDRDGIARESEEREEGGLRGYFLWAG